MYISFVNFSFVSLKKIENQSISAYEVKLFQTYYYSNFKINDLCRLTPNAE